MFLRDQTTTDVVHDLAATLSTQNIYQTDENMSKTAGKIFGTCTSAICRERIKHVNVNKQKIVKKRKKKASKK